MDTNNPINPTQDKKLSFQLWLENWKKTHCRTCLWAVPNPNACYVCYQQREVGFRCSFCSNWICYLDRQKICGGLYDTGNCFCDHCRTLIERWRRQRKCSCEFSLAGYCDGHSIHFYQTTINGLVQPFFRGSHLWVKLVCRSCKKLIQTFKLNCSCYLKQREHKHSYSQEKCLSCLVGFPAWPLSESDLRAKYKDYCQFWQMQAEIQANRTARKSYQYVGLGYWAECSFCENKIQGQKTHQEPLQRNKVGFWTGKETDGRIICNLCLRENKKVLKELKIKGSKRQILYNYRARGLI